MLIFESPKPPPSLVAHTPGVVFRISGNSWLPSLMSIVPCPISEMATGVIRVFATDCVTTTSWSIVDSTSRTIVPMLRAGLTVTPLKPIAEILISLALPGAFNVNFPSTSVIVPTCVPGICNVAPIMGSPFFSVTIPRQSYAFCACTAPNAIISIVAVKRSSLFIPF